MSRSNPVGPVTHLLPDGGSSGWRADTRRRQGSTLCSRAVAVAADLTVALPQGDPRRPADTNTVFLR